MANLLQDIAFGFRVLIKNPAVTVIAVLSLALGIAANTTIFSLINATLLGSLPYSEPDRVVMLWTVPLQRPENRNSVAAQNYMAWKKESKSFEAMGTAWGLTRNLGADQSAPAERLQGLNTAPETFKALGVQPLMGRVYSEAEDQVDNPAPVMVLSYRFWQRHFAGSPDVIGKTVRLDSVETTVIGVMPERFSFMDDEIDFFAPQGLTKVQIASAAAFLTVPARLKPGVSIKQAQAEMDGIAAQLRTADPLRNKDRGIKVETIHDSQFGGGFKQSLLVLQVAVGFVLLIACANVGGLLLARATSRRAEVAVRSALGAGRWRIARQLLTESVILSIVGGALGMLLSWWGIRLLVASLPQGTLPTGQIAVDLRVLIFTAAVSVVAGLFFGLIPAIQTSKTNLAGALRETGRSAMAGTFRQRLRQVMVTVQIALALVLLVGAGLMINSFVHLQRNEVGMNTENVLTFEFRFSQNELMKVVGRHKNVGLWEIFPQTTMTFDRINERLQGLPGITSAAAVSSPPLTGSMGMSFTIEGRPAPQPSDGNSNQMNGAYFAISPKYFATMKIPVLRGRDFDSRDTAAGTQVVIINQTMARRFWPDEDPIGKRLTFDFVPDDMPREVVGVVGDTRTYQFEEKTRPAMYVPHIQQTTHWQGPAWGARAAMFYVVRTPNDPMTVLPAIRRAVAEIDSTKPVAEVRTVEQYVERQTSGIRLYTILMSIFGIVAAALSAVGIYGVMSYSVAQRTHEIGVRMALGAGRGDVFGLVLRQAVVMISVGVVVGLGGAFGLTRFISGQLWGVKATDPATYIAVALVLIVVAVVATVIPTRRAVQVDPTVALRYE